MPKILFLSRSNYTFTQNGGLTSDVASARYRILIPGKKLEQIGLSVSYHTLSESDYVQPEDILSRYSPTHIILGKVDDIRVTHIAEYVKKFGVNLIVDYCDNYFQKPTKKDLYYSLASLADTITANTKEMADEICRLTRRSATVVIDPVEGKRTSPRNHYRANLIEFVWFGYPMNLPFLFALLNSWVNNGIVFPGRLNIITNVHDKLRAVAHQWNQKAAGPKINLIQWSESAVVSALTTSNIALLPTENNHITRTKSANRVVEALWAGCLVVTNSLPSYLEFQKFCLIDISASELVQHIGNPEAYLEKILAGQDYISRHYTPDVACQQWLKVMKI